mmetsp:Transcript_6545/g.11470  ORF Transcript_6545/g.11470 Transcript_6545/m.11470 type:complete len:223 (-) Transcript_6545:2954-3622(-)
MGTKNSHDVSDDPWAEELEVHECSDGRCDCYDWQRVRLSIYQRRLEIYEADCTLLELTLGHDIAVMAEQPGTMEFILTFDHNGAEKFWRVKAPTMHVYLSCVNTLKVNCRPPWTPNTVKNCEACETRFSLLMKRHHCRYCGSLVCNDCSEYEALIPTLGYNSPQRVCKVCWKLLDRYKRRVMRASKVSKSMCNAASYLHTIEAERFSRIKDKKTAARSIMSC